jgi:hypothetical protein
VVRGTLKVPLQHCQIDEHRRGVQVADPHQIIL